MVEVRDARARQRLFLALLLPDDAATDLRTRLAPLQQRTEGQLRWRSRGFPRTAADGSAGTHLSQCCRSCTDDHCRTTAVAGMRPIQYGAVGWRGKQGLAHRTCGAAQRQTCRFSRLSCFPWTCDCRSQPAPRHAGGFYCSTPGLLRARMGPRSTDVDAFRCGCGPALPAAAQLAVSVIPAGFRYYSASTALVA